MYVREQEARDSAHASPSAQRPCSTRAPHAGNARHHFNGTVQHAAGSVMRTLEHVLETLLDKLVRAANEREAVDVVELCRDLRRTKAASETQCRPHMGCQPMCGLKCNESNAAAQQSSLSASKKALDDRDLHLWTHDCSHLKTCEFSLHYPCVLPAPILAALTLEPKSQPAPRGDTAQVSMSSGSLHMRSQKGPSCGISHTRSIVRTCARHAQHQPPQSTKLLLAKMQGAQQPRASHAFTM